MEDFNEIDIATAELLMDEITGKLIEIYKISPNLKESILPLVKFRIGRAVTFVMRDYGIKEDEEIEISVTTYSFMTLYFTLKENVSEIIVDDGVRVRVEFVESEDPYKFTLRFLDNLY